MVASVEAEANAAPVAANSEAYVEITHYGNPNTNCIVVDDVVCADCSDSHGDDYVINWEDQPGFNGQCRTVTLCVDET